MFQNFLGNRKIDNYLKNKLKNVKTERARRLGKKQTNKTNKLKTKTRQGIGKGTQRTAVPHCGKRKWSKPFKTGKIKVLISFQFLL